MDCVEQIKEISGVNPLKCMKCGKCSASCPSYNEMDIKPHQFVSYVQDGDIEALVQSKSLYKCLSCFACIERCPRDVKPGKLIDAARQLLIRQKGQDYLSADDIPSFWMRRPLSSCWSAPSESIGGKKLCRESVYLSAIAAVTSPPPWMFPVWRSWL